jgi:small redox-active disulfide protein 2
MSDDTSQIWVGDGKVGLRGLKEAIKEIARSHAERPDEEIQDALLERLSEKNYIASCAKKEYREAFLREFRKFLGQPYEEAAVTSLRVAVLGPGCSQCNRLEQTVKQTLTEMKLPASVRHVTDMKEIAQYGMVRTPALVVNGKVAAMGTVPSSRRMKEILTEANRNLVQYRS